MTAARTEERLALCDPAAVPHFRAALGRAQAYGTDAYVERDPWRTLEQQAEKVKAGFSQVLDSAHTHVEGGDPAHKHTMIDHVTDARPGVVDTHCTCGARPASRAIHLVSTARFYFAESPGLLPAFAVRVGAACLKEGLVTGVLYPPRSKERERQLHWRDGIYPELRMAMWDERWREAELVFVTGQKIGGCWDPLHGEWRPS